MGQNCIQEDSGQPGGKSKAHHNRICSPVPQSTSFLEVLRGMSCKYALHLSITKLLFLEKLVVSLHFNECKYFDRLWRDMDRLNATLSAP